MLISKSLMSSVVLLTLLALQAAPLLAAEETKSTGSSLYASATVDLGIVVSDMEKSAKWYTEVLGLKELDGFSAPADFVSRIGLSNKLGIQVRVFAVDSGEKATKLKLMQFKTAPGARVDQTYIHSTYGFRYVTLFVNDIEASMAKVTAAGVKPIGEGVTPLPEGLPAGVFIAVLRDPDGNFVELVGPKAKK